MYFRFMIVPNVWIQSYSRDKIPLDQLNRPDIDYKRIMFTEMKHSVTGMLSPVGQRDRKQGAGSCAIRQIEL